MILDNTTFNIDEHIKPVFLDLWYKGPGSMVFQNLLTVLESFPGLVVDEIMAKRFDGRATDEVYNPFFMATLLTDKGFKVIYPYGEIIEASREFRFRITPCGHGFRVSRVDNSISCISEGTMRELADFMDEICSKTPYIRQCIAEEYAAFQKRQRMCEIALKVALSVIPKQMQCTIDIASPSLYCVTLYYGKKKHRSKYISEERLVQIDSVLKRMVRSAKYASFVGEKKDL